MKKRFAFLVSIILISLIVSVSAFLASKNANSSPAVLSCNVLQENPGGINIVFFSTESQAKRYSDYLLALSPFSENKEKFNFYFITPEQFAPECSIYRGIALLCQSSSLTRAASVCPNDYIAVLGEKPSSIRSSAFKGVMSLNTNHPTSVFAHELGHVMVNLAEEYFADGAGLPKNSENCQKECSGFNKFQGSFGCYSECTGSDYSREFDDGFMRTLDAVRYGPYDELLISETIDKKFQSSITGSAISTEVSCENQHYYLVEQTQDGFTTTLETGCASGGNAFGDFTFQLKDSEGNILTQSALQSSTIFMTDYNPASNGEITQPPEETILPILFTIPAETNQESSLEILDENQNVIYRQQLNKLGATPCKN